MKKIVISLIIMFFVASLSYAQLTNISDYTWESTTGDPFSDKTNIATNFYKFVVMPPFGARPPQPYSNIIAVSVVKYASPGTILSIVEYIHNVGSIDEANGIKLSISPITSICPGVTVSLPSSTLPIASGNSRSYTIDINIPRGCDGTITFNITNSGSLGLAPYPYKYIIKYTIHATPLFVNKATDGIWSIELFDGSGTIENTLGNLNAEIYVEIPDYIADSSSQVELYYYVEAIDGTVGKNRVITLKKEGDYWVGTIPITDPEIQPGSMVNFVIKIDGNEYDNKGEPWKYKIKEYAVQPESKYTKSIKNMFDPTKGEKYHLIYKLNRKSFVNISIFSIRGELVRQLKHEVQDIGRWEVEWDGKNDTKKPVAMGLYLINIETAEYGDIRKVIVVLR